MIKTKQHLTKLKIYNENRYSKPYVHNQNDQFQEQQQHLNASNRMKQIRLRTVTPYDLRMAECEPSELHFDRYFTFLNHFWPFLFLPVFMTETWAESGSQSLGAMRIASFPLFFLFFCITLRLRNRIANASNRVRGRSHWMRNWSTWAKFQLYCLWVGGSDGMTLKRGYHSIVSCGPQTDSVIDCG